MTWETVSCGEIVPPILAETSIVTNWINNPILSVRASTFWVSELLGVSTVLAVVCFSFDLPVLLGGSPVNMSVYFVTALYDLS